MLMQSTVAARSTVAEQPGVGAEPTVAVQPTLVTAETAAAVGVAAVTGATFACTRATGTTGREGGIAAQPANSTLTDDERADATETGDTVAQTLDRTFNCGDRRRYGRAVASSVTSGASRAEREIRQATHTGIASTAPGGDVLHGGALSAQ